MNDISIIILNYNTADLTLNCVRSILQYTKQLNLQIIILDNNSSDDSNKILNKNFKNNKSIKLVKSSINLGFSKGNNKAAKKANGKYLLFLNSDTVIEDNSIKDVYDFLENNKQYDIATCRLVNKDGSVQGTGGYFPNLIRVASWMTIQDLPLVDQIIKPFHPQKSKSIFKNDNFYRKDRDLDWVTGAFMMIRADKFKKVNGFSEDYFMYTEDTDLSYKIKKLGGKVRYLSSPHVIHLGGQSSSDEYPILSEFESIKIFFKKYYPKWQYPILILLLKIGSLVRVIAFAILFNKSSVQTYAKAFKKI